MISTTRFRSKKWLAAVRENPCLVCGSPCTVAHHVTFTAPAAMSLKVPDDMTVPLCDMHHKELHAHGNELRWWALQGVDPEKWIAKFKSEATDSSQ